MKKSAQSFLVFLLFFGLTSNAAAAPLSITGHGDARIALGPEDQVVVALPEVEELWWMDESSMEATSRALPWTPSLMAAGEGYLALYGQGFEVGAIDPNAQLPLQRFGGWKSYLPDYEDPTIHSRIRSRSKMAPYEDGVLLFDGFGAQLSLHRGPDFELLYAPPASLEEKRHFVRRSTPFLSCGDSLWIAYLEEGSGEQWMVTLGLKDKEVKARHSAPLDRKMRWLGAACLGGALQTFGVDEDGALFHARADKEGRLGSIEGLGEVDLDKRDLDALFLVHVEERLLLLSPSEEGTWSQTIRLKEGALTEATLILDGLKVRDCEQQGERTRCVAAGDEEVRVFDPGRDAVDPLSIQAEPIEDEFFLPRSLRLHLEEPAPETEAFPEEVEEAFTEWMRGALRSEPHFLGGWMEGMTLPDAFFAFRSGTWLRLSLNDAGWWVAEEVEAPEKQLKTHVEEAFERYCLVKRDINCDWGPPSLSVSELALEQELDFILNLSPEGYCSVLHYSFQWKNGSLWIVAVGSWICDETYPSFGKRSIGR